MKLLIYILTAYIFIAYIIPFTTTLCNKLFYYIKIKNTCKKCNYKIVLSLLKWLFSSVKNKNPEMFIKTDKAVYSIKNYGFYKKPNYYVFMRNKNNFEIQIIRRIYWIGYVILKNIKLGHVNYDCVEKYFGEHNLPVIDIILFCPKCVGAAMLKFDSPTIYMNYVDMQNTFKIFGKTILKIRNLIVNPYSSGTESYITVPKIRGAESVELSNGNMFDGAYIYNIKSFINRRLLSSDELVDNIIGENMKKFTNEN